MVLFLLFALLLGARLSAQPILHAAASFTKEYVVGAKLPPSGVFRRTGAGRWELLGHPHPFVFSMERDPQVSGAVLLVAGNGLIRVAGGTGRWTILTGSDVTELRDLVLDPRQANSLYIAHVRGVRHSTDGGRTWRELASSRVRQYTEQVGLDTQSGALLAGMEDGIYRTEDSGRTWHLAGARGFGILRLQSSPHDSCFWLAGTQQGGLFASRDCGRTFENLGNVGVGSNLYDVAFDPVSRSRIAVAGWGVGVMVSNDGGQSWMPRHQGLPNRHVTSVVFDPVTPGRLFAALHEEALFVSDDAGLTWREDGLRGGHVNRLRFLEVGR